MARIDSKGNLINDNISTYTTIDSQGNLQFNHNPTPKKKKKNENTWFDTGALSDGYDFGDVTKTILGTASDIGASVLKGVSDTGLGIAKAGVGGIAMASEALGNKEYAEKLRNRLAGKDEEVNKRLEAIDVFGNTSKALTDSSVLGNTTESILSGVGNYAGMAAAQSVGIPWQLTAGLSAAGAGLEEAYKNDASDKEAWISATVDAGAEILSEYIFGGLKLPGTGKTTEKMLGGLTKKISNKVIRGITEFGINAAGEGLEEIISGQISAIGKKLTYMTDKELNEIYSNEDKFNDFIAGALSTVVANGVNPNTYQNVKAGRSLITNYTNNEQDLIDSLVDKIASESGQKKSKVEESVKEDLENGEISLDDIEKSLGGDRYTQYQAELQRENTINEEIKKLEDMKAADITVKQQEKLKSLREQLEEQTKKVKDLGKDLTNYVYQNTQNDELIQRSYNEYFKKGQKYEIDSNKKYSKKQMEQIQKAMDSGLINNTRQMHLLMNNIAQIHEDKNITFNFMNSEQAKEHLIQKQIEKHMKNNGLTELSEEQRNALYKQYQEDFKNRVVNGFVENGEVFLNVDSPKYLNAVMGHEITHLFEGDSKLYKNLRKEVLEFAKTKEEYKSRIEQLGENYKEIDSDLETELVNDIIGDYLFTDEEFVRKLSKNKNIFQKIYDEIKYLAKVITGRKEQAQLQKVKNMFDKVYREIDVNQDNKSKYMIASTKGMKNAIKYDSENKGLKSLLNEAKKLKKEGKSNEDIRRKTWWFQDPNKKWVFEISDKDSSFIKRLEKDKTYKLGDIFKHDDLFELYPSLKNQKVRIEHIDTDTNAGKVAGVYNVFSKLITLESDYLGKTQMKKTLLHELQHRIQSIEGLENGNTGDDNVKYFTSLGEIATSDVEKRKDMTYKELMKNVPEISKNNPIHQVIQSIHNNPNSEYSKKLLNKPDIAELYNEIYNNGKEGEYNREEIFRKGITKNISKTENEISHSIRKWINNNGNNRYQKVIKEINSISEELDNSSFSYDNQGRELSKQQQEYFKDSKVRDENGNLKVMYHGSPNKNFTIFDITKAKASGLYGKGFYFTPYSTMAGNYNNFNKGKIYETYINSINPLTTKTNDITREQFKKFVEKVAENEDYSIENYGTNNIDKIVDMVYGKGDFGILQDINATAIGDLVETVKLFNKVNGTNYDGIDVIDQFVVFEPNQIKNVDNTNPTTNDDIRYSLTAANEIEERHYMDLLKKGKSNEEIYLETGLFEGMDGKVRKEIDDSNAKIKLKDSIWSGGHYKMEQVLDFPELYEIYPGLKRYNVIFETMDSPDQLGRLSKDRMAIIINNNVYDRDAAKIQNDIRNFNDWENTAKNYELFGFNEEQINRQYEKLKQVAESYDESQPYQEKLKSVLLHEIQHFIQDQEGFAQGSNTEYWTAVKRITSEKLAEYNTDRDNLLNELGFDEKFDEIMKEVKEKDLGYEDMRKMIDDFLYNPENNPKIKELREIDSALKNLRNRYEIITGRSAFELYQDTYGEQEARNVQERMNMSPEERRKTMPFAGDERTIFYENALNKEKLNKNISYSISNTTGKLQENGKDIKLDASDTGTSGTLMAIHNLNEDKLKGILELGGFPVPSIAITNPNLVDHKQFGDISVLFNKNTIDPSNRYNEVYDRDVWSPTFPQIDYELNDDAIDKVADNLGIESWRLRDEAEDNTKPEYLIERLLREEKLIDKYIKDNNIDYETAYKDAETRVDFHQRGEKIRKFIIDNDFDFRKLYKDEKLQKEYFDLIKDYYDNSTLPPAVKENLYNEEILKLKDYIDFQKGAGDLDPVRQLIKYQKDFDLIKSGDTKVVDEWQTNKNKKEAAINNGIENYLKEQVKDIYGDKGIRNDREIFTPSGNRRSFWQLHDEYNLDNIVDALTKGETTGTQSWFAGYGQIQANMANRFNSINDIKANESKLTSLSEENEKLTEARDNIENDIDEIVAKNDTDMMIVSELLADFARGDLTIDNFKELTRNYYQTTQNVPDSLINKIIKDMKALRDLPTDYFEAKPQRAVGLDEVQQIVIPNNLDAEFKKQLQENGLQYIEYDPNIEGDRQRVINQFDDLKFSISNKNEDIAPIGNYRIKGEDIKLQDIAPIETNQNNKIVKDVPNDELPFETEDDFELPFDYEEPLELNGLDDKTINKITKNLKSELSLNPYEVKEFKNVLSDISKQDNITKDKIYNLLEKKFGEKEFKVRIDEIADIKKQLRNTKIFVPDYVKIDIPDYSDFRQRNYGKINFSKEGMAVDKVYDELAEMHPEYFDKEISNEADQLQEIARVANLDKYITDSAYLDKFKIENAANWIYDSIEDYNLQQEVKKGTLGYNEYLEKSKQKDLKKTRKMVQDELNNEMGITVDDLEVGKDISSLGYQRTDPIRLNEKVFGAEIGKKINDATIRRTNHNEAERTRFLNKEREEIAKLGIKARSKESAAVQKYGEKQYINDKGELLPYGDVELAREFSDAATQDKIKNAARVLRNKYDVYIDEINKVITDMGYDPIPKRPDYMRHFQEINDKLSEWGVPLNRDSLSKDTLPTDINGITDQFKPGKNWFASAMQRKGLKTTYDAITGIDGYLEGASNLIYHTGDIQRYRTLSKMIRDTYGQSHGLDNVDLDTKEGQQRLNDIMDNKLSKYAAWLDEQANALAGKKGGIDRAAERLLGRKIYTIADTAKKQVGSNMTGFNVRSALTNFASAVQGASKTNKLAFLKGTISTIKNMINNDGLIDKSDFLTNRFGSDTLSKKLWQKASNAGQILMTGSDYFTANQIWRSKYYENLSKGMNETEAIKNADDFASRIMGDRSKGMTAELFNSKTLGLLTQFQLEVNNQWSSIVHDNKMDVQRGNKSGATVLFQLGQLAAMSYLFNNFMKSMTGSDVMLDPLDILKELFGWNDDEDEETSLEERSQKVLGNIVNNLPFASFMTGGRIPISEAFTGAETAFKKLTGQKDKFGNEIKWEDVKDDVISSGAYWLLPTGYGQIRKTTKGMSMYDEKLPLPGSYTNSGNLRFTADDTTGAKIKAALFGEYSSKEAQEYRESGYETINAKNIDLLKELGMNSTEFRKFEDKKDAATGTTLNKDGVKYTKYADDNNNTYWYNKNTKELYDDNFNKSNKNVTELNKVSSNELLFDYISNSYFSEKQKQALFKNYFTNATTDQYGYEKYQDSNKKTYWYDKDKNVLYDSKYNKVSTSKLDSLNKVSSSKDMSNYKNYNSYEEADYAIKNPEKYAASKLITNSYSNYKKYTDDISKIESDKDANGKTISNSKKRKVFEYINNLNEDYMSKVILFKMYYPSDKTYNTEIFNYLNNSTNLTLDEKKKVLKGLGATITEQGTVRW